ncbi:hypothetical protein DPMN_028934 [Dreissena polymorpha]|uniref:Uncharacterized protein n=1 Tax=Dreissena polymorpha TaxID=45954 RepID=A0A9D4RGX4_DREPO|nr:hypothetical protein DPMN_028934 [Dreissena polymorpha]
MIGHQLKTAPPTGGHVFQRIGTTFELNQDIIKTNILTNFKPGRDFIGTKLLTKFHEDGTRNVASRVLTSKSHLSNQATELNKTRVLTRFYYSRIRRNAPPPNIIIFELIQDIIETNLLTKFHEDWTINVASRENFPAPGGHVFKATKTIFELIQDIIGTNLLFTIYKENAQPPRKPYIIGMNLLTEKNSPPPLFTRKNDPPPGGHVFQLKGIISKLVQYIIGMNLLTKFHEDWTINVASRVLTRFYYSHIRTRDVFWTDRQTPYIIHLTFTFTFHHSKFQLLYATLPAPLGSHVFQTKVTIFKLILDIIGTNLLTKFHEDRKKMWPLVLTRKNVPPPGGQVNQPTGIIFQLVQDIIGMNLLTKFHEDWTITVASRVKNALPLGSHVFQTKFYEDQKINVASRVLTRKNALPPGDHVFQPIGIIFELVKDIIRMNLLTKFHEDQTINVASRVLTRKNALPLGSHVFQANVTIFILIQDIIETNLLTKFHEDWTISVASRELTRQILTPHNGRRTKGDHKSSL